MPDRTGFREQTCPRPASRQRDNVPHSTAPLVAFQQSFKPTHEESSKWGSRFISRPRSKLRADFIPSATDSSARISVLSGEGVDDESLEHVVMAVDVREKGKLGCAYYIALEERLLCMDDIANGGFDTMERLKLDLQPTVVLLSPRADALSEQLGAQRPQRQLSLVDDDNQHSLLPYEVDLRPKIEFNYERALSKLASIHTPLHSKHNFSFLVPGDSIVYDDDPKPNEIGLTCQKGRLLGISAYLDLDNRVGIGCVGAVINYMQRKWSEEYLQDDPAAHLNYRVIYLEMFTFRDSMLLNTDTLTALQIIQPEPHPNTSNQGNSGSKESLSVYGLFHHSARTPQGKSRLRQFFLRPCLKIGDISYRLEFVSVFVRPYNQHAAQKLSRSLSKIKNVRSSMTLLHKGVEGNGISRGFKRGVWTSLLEFCYHAIDIADILREIVGAERLPLCTRAAETFDRSQLQRIGKMIHDIVDSDLSQEQYRTVVKRGIDANLDRFKDVYDSMDEILGRTAIEIAREIPFGIDANLNVIYFPQLGFHITVPVDDRTGEAIYSGGHKAWEKMFTTRTQVYFKDEKMREMDSELGDLYASICDIEIEVVYDLAQRVLEDEQLLIAASDLCGELDSLLALAHGAIKYNLTRPKLTETNVIDIKKGRHLLQEMTVPSYVPNDTYLWGGSDVSRVPTGTLQPSSMMVLTGPNYSGKSVYQKQVALIVYMTHIGSYVPAEAATIGITDKIFTRITTRETVSKAQSAFMIDVQQIATAINSCTNKSLIIIDEFGKGTDTCDGAGLAAGVLAHLLDRRDECPKVLAATHFHEIFETGIFENRPNLMLAHMEVQVDQKAKQTTSHNGSDMTYLYNLQSGRSIISHGIQCAAMNGIPNQIVLRATELAEYMTQGRDLVAVCSMLSAQEAEDLENAEVVARVFLEQDFEVVEDILGMLGEILNASTEMLI